MPRPQQFIFDEVAELYHRSRPDYPNELFDNLVAFAGLEAGARVLEVGCGTGQATRPLAERGCEVLCLEPGQNLARIARSNLAEFQNVEVRCSTFEESPLEPESFALMICAQSFHWIREEERFVKPAEQRETLHAATTDRINASGGRIEIGYVANLYVAGRSS